MMNFFYQVFQERGFVVIQDVDFFLIHSFSLFYLFIQCANLYLIKIVLFLLYLTPFLYLIKVVFLLLH
ncbi:hypothetical protein BJ944DRAFT_261082 [Cunninghamella echinulata]|nr:hypothetical protein BJ944DRAFT_261082 [Cunninghamella echinulata]